MEYVRKLIALLDEENDKEKLMERIERLRLGIAQSRAALILAPPPLDRGPAFRRVGAWVRFPVGAPKRIRDAAGPTCK